MNRMSGTLVLVITFLLLVGVSTAQVPDLLGTWNGSVTAHIEDTGFVEGMQGSIIMNITEQKDRIFIGEIMIYNKDGTFRTEKFSGIIEKGGEEFLIVEHDKGFSMGDILGPDEIELIYIEDDEEKSVIIASNHLFRTQE